MVATSDLHLRLTGEGKVSANWTPGCQGPFCTAENKFLVLNSWQWEEAIDNYSRVVCYHYYSHKNSYLMTVFLFLFFFFLFGRFCAWLARHFAFFEPFGMCQHKSSVKWFVLTSSGVHLMVKSTYNGYCFWRIIHEIKPLGQVIVHKNVSHLPRSFSFVHIPLNAACSLAKVGLVTMATVFCLVRIST